MEKIKFPELELLFENSAVVVSSTPVITFSGLPPVMVQFWKRNYPKGKGEAKANMLLVMMNDYFDKHHVMVNPDGSVSPLPISKDEKKG